MKRGKLIVIDSLFGLVLLVFLVVLFFAGVSYTASVLDYPRKALLILAVLAVALAVLYKTSSAIRTRMAYYVILKELEYKAKELPLLVPAFSRHRNITQKEGNMKIRPFLSALRKTGLLCVNWNDEYEITMKGRSELNNLKREFE